MFCFPLLYNFQEEFSIILNCKLPLDGIIVIKKCASLEIGKAAHRYIKRYLSVRLYVPIRPAPPASIPIFFMLNALP